MATIAELLYLFRDGQAAKTIGPEPFQAMISELHLASGFFQDMPRSPAGLTNGRLYLNGDIVQMATGSITASPTANFLGVGTAALLANVSSTRAAAGANLPGSSTLFANPLRFAIVWPGNFLGSGGSTLFADPQTLLSTSQFANFVGSGVGSLTSDAIRTPLGAASEAGAGNLTATASWIRMAGNATAAGTALVLAVPTSRRTTNATIAAAAAALAAPTSRRTTNATTGGAGAVIAVPGVRSVANSSTMAGAAAVNANPIKPNAFSSEFSSEFG